VLGQAGPCAFREDDNLPGIGTLTLDSDDLASSAGTQTLTDIVFHEIGHILGIGTLWEGFDCTPGTTLCRNFLTGTSGDDPTFVGPRAVQEWRALGGTGNVPVENTGGSGTKLSHWRETSFDSEIMTGFIERNGIPNPLSRVTIGSMADLGYIVTYAAANAYTLPPGGAALLAPALLQDGWEIPLLEPPVPLSSR